MPDDAVAEADPSHNPLQLTFTIEPATILTVGPFGVVNDTVVAAVHPLLSVLVIVYVIVTLTVPTQELSG